MLSLSTSRLGVTFFMPTDFFLGKPFSLLSFFLKGKGFLRIPFLLHNAQKREESVASEDLQHSLFVLVQKYLLFLRNRVKGFGRLWFFGSSRDVACGEKIAVNQRMTAERSRSLLDDGQKLLRHHWEWLLLREH